MFEQDSVLSVIKELQTDRERGLSSNEASKRLTKYGRNEMPEGGKKTLLQSFLEQMMDPLIYVLIVAAGLSVFLGEFSDAVIIGIVVVLNACIGMLQESKAKKALDSLKKLASPRAVVIRDGRRWEVPSAELVVGDLVCLEAGCQVPADLRLVNAVNLKVEESALTGESLPIEKDAAYVAPSGKKILPGDRKNMAYMTTNVTFGRGEGIVTATGIHTEIGNIAAMLTETKEELTPLQKRLGDLGKVLSVLSLVLCALLFIIAVIQKRNLPEMLITAISLAVAAVPEGLPAVVTICLALSVTKLVKVNTIVRKLPSVETLGAVSVVCSDKTGTLTQNRMTVEKCFFAGRILPVEKWSLSEIRELVCGMVLCNDAVIDGENRIGDPTELALLDLGERLGIGKEEAERRHPRVGELAFDSDRKMMSTLHQIRKSSEELMVLGFSRENAVQYTKGAPDQILNRCDRVLTDSGVLRLTDGLRLSVLKAVAELSVEALRTLGLAAREVNPGGNTGVEERNLIFIGLVGMRDPVRPEAIGAVQDFEKAGVKTVMITGDHVDTAFAIGKQLGIVRLPRQCMSGEELGALDEDALQERMEETRVFARVSPAQKVQIVDAFKKRGEIVAMTGDGVNDAPSLRRADIGIAMGKMGTDVAREAADMILTDDNFATIRRAIEEGRGVYENIRKSVIFLLSSNLGEIITMFIAVVCGLASPLRSSHILWINLITDSLPALALGIDKNDGTVLMKQKPRKAQESLFARGGLICTCFYGFLIGTISLVAFTMLPVVLLRIKGEIPSLGGVIEMLKEDWVLSKAQTYTFTVLGMSQLFHAVGMRDTSCSVFRMKHFENRLMILACALGFLLQFAVTEIPFLVNAFGTSALSWGEWRLLILLSAVPMLAHEILSLPYSTPR